MVQIEYVKRLKRAINVLESFTVQDLLTYMIKNDIEIESYTLIDQILDSNLLTHSFEKYYVKH